MPEDSLCITIKAIQNNSTITSISNEVCLIVKTIWVSLYNSSVDINNQTNLSWKWSTNLPFKIAEIFAGNSLANITNKLAYNTPSVLPDSVLYIDLASNPGQAPVYYQIRITDFCNNYTYSNILSTVHLNATAGSGFINKLNWDFPAHENIIVSGYQIHRIINNQDVILNSVSSGDVSLMDPVDIDNPEEEYICYYLVAEASAELLPGQIQTVNIKSNIACVGQSGSLFFPNAIVPDGLNNEFKPVGVFTDNGEYSLLIFDRWGKKVFETNDISEGWKGYSNGAALPIGLYAYIAELKQLNGNVIRQKGTVMLVR